MLAIVISISPHLHLSIFSHHTTVTVGVVLRVTVTHHVLPPVWAQIVSVLASLAVSYTIQSLVEDPMQNTASKNSLVCQRRSRAESR